MRYVSLFSGIGGLEARNVRPLAMCESDPSAAVVLARTYPGMKPWPDVATFRPPAADLVVGGWPCQDITPAGREAGLSGKHSRLFFRMVEIAIEAGAHTFVGENVPRLLTLNGGEEFWTVLRSLSEAGFRHVAWRTLDPRQFGIPQERPRVYIVASKQKERALGLHARIRSRHWVQSGGRGPSRARSSSVAIGFYWTGGGRRSICYREGYTPALKVGAAPPKGGTSPVAVFYDNVVRKLSPRESLRLQGFDTAAFQDVVAGEILRMAGNAVPRPVGHFVMGCASAPERPEGVLNVAAGIEESGAFLGGRLFHCRHTQGRLADNLMDFIDDCADRLSAQAAAGLLTRTIKFKRIIPVALFNTLHEMSLNETKALKGTKVNSFEILHRRLDVKAFRAWLVSAVERARETA